MSRRIGSVIDFSCSSDCEQGGCPGHKIREVFDRSSDVYTFEVDGRPRWRFDENELEALLSAHRTD